MIEPRPRIEAVDAARGVALAAMAVYHFVWDLSFYRLIPQGAFYNSGFLFFGHAIALSFLVIVGVSLALAARGEFKVRHYWRRMGMVAGAAALVSLGTYVFLPDAFVAFGILHCIAAGSLIALPFLRAQWFAALAAGALIVVAPLALSSPAFDGVNWFLGLGVTEPRTLDWRPLFPWTGFTLLGLAFAQWALARGVPERLARWRAGGGLSRLFVAGGRHSLLVYLLHQPILIAIVFVAATAAANLGAGRGDDMVAESNFRASCVQECAASGVERGFCERACGCVVQEAKNAGLWRQALRDAFTAEERARFDALTRACLRPAAAPLR